MDELTLYTIGHPNLPVEALIDALLANAIELVVDVRHYPMSRRNPQFNRETLAATLAAHDVAYKHLVALGGRRPVRPDSPNTALREPGFRGFADYMATPEFAAGLDELVAAARSQRTAFMCAEAVPWRCHRSLISDALVARGLPVEHIVGGRLRTHTLSPIAHVEDERVNYPALL